MFIKLYLIALPVFLGIDMIWLGFIAKSFYQQQIGFLMKSDVNWSAGLLFYLLFIAGIVLFVVKPSLEKGSVWEAILMGALFGLICYATYDLTNLATIKNWPVLVTVIDLLWGATLSSIVSVVTFLIAQKLGITK